jgi:hypothetical protein
MALAFYFGWVLTNSRMAYYGIEASALDFSVQDYLLRSADALFVPLGTAAAVALGAVWLHAHAIRQLADRTRRARLRIAAQASVVAGGGLFAAALPFPVSQPGRRDRTTRLRASPARSCRRRRGSSDRASR